MYATSCSSAATGQWLLYRAAERELLVWAMAVGRGGGACGLAVSARSLPTSACVCGRDGALPSQTGGSAGAGGNGADSLHLHGAALPPPTPQPPTRGCLQAGACLVAHECQPHPICPCAQCPDSAPCSGGPSPALAPPAVWAPSAQASRVGAPNRSQGAGASEGLRASVGRATPSLPPLTSPPPGSWAWPGRAAGNASPFGRLACRAIKPSALASASQAVAQADAKIGRRTAGTGCAGCRQRVLIGAPTCGAWRSLILHAEMTFSLQVPPILQAT